tara:strand:- start:3779 stop:4903 length:1125 start_codon:yes stop_codon:yes gene_type:complete
MSLTTRAKGLEMDKMGNLESKRIGFLPNSADFSHPQDRRRYIPFLKDLGIKLETAIFTEHYDVLYLSLNCDLNLWSKYKDHHAPANTKIILDLSDNYLADGYLKSVIRSVAHFLFGRTKSLIWDYRTTIRNAIQASDLITVGSLEQKIEMESLHKNIIVIRDFFDQDICDDLKTKPRTLDSSINIFWEGFSHGCIPIFRQLKAIVGELKSESDQINLHVVTDNKICGLMGRFFCTGTEKALKKLFKNSIVRVQFYNWTIENLNNAASACDFAIILLPNDPYLRSKPENKLLLCWSLGLPTLVSDTPSYSRVMQDSGNIDCILSANNEWALMIKEFSQCESKRDSSLETGLQYMSNKMSYEVMLKTWRLIFNHEV